MPSTASFSGKRMLIEINKVMDSMEAKHRSAFLDSIQKLTGNIELLAIVNDIRSGTITKIDGGVLARIDKVQVDMASLTQISRQAMGLGGKITAKTVGLEGAFDVTNEMAIDAARTISANLANVLKKSVSRTIGSIIQDAVSGVDSPYETVKRIQSEIGLTPAHAQSVKIYRQNLINSGVDKARAIKQAEAYAKRLLKYRARTIARTEVSIAVNVGQLEFWKQMLSRGSLPANTKRVWIAELDGKVCGVCKPLNGELASIDGYWVTAGGSFDIPHAHPNCRCTSGLVFPTPFSKADDVGYESWVISKGESAGHPFRGNQWVEGISGASEFTQEEFDGFARKTGLSWDIFPKPLKQYAFVSYEAVNINLRRGKGKPQTFFDEQIIEAWASVAQEFPSDSIVYRGVPIDLPSPDFVVGDIIQNNGFTSTSRKEEVAREFSRIGNPTNKAGVLYKITIPKGTRAVPMISHPQYNFTGRGEDEILFAPTLKLKINKIEKVQGIFREKVQGNFREKVQEIYRVEAEVVGYETDATIENKKLIYKGDKDKSEFIGNYKEMKKRYQSEEYWEIVTKAQNVTKGESAGHPFRGNQYTGGISAGVSSFNAPYGSVDIEYGELNFNVLTSSVDPTDENWEHAYTEFSEWQGNYRMRHASAALMGMKSPKAHGGEVGDVGANEIIRTGKVGDPFNGHYSVDEAKESIVKAYVGLKRVEESPPSTLPLYRGMVVDGKSSILSSPIGEDFVMPLTSFSYSKIVATEFAGGGFSSTNSEETVKKSTPVLVVLRKGARAADASYTDSIEINGSWVEVPIESVTQGKFRIVSRRKVMLPEGSGFRIEIEQIGVYSMDKNTFISKMTQKIPDWVWEMNGSFAQHD